MATVNYSWTLPTVGASVNTWGTLLNTIIDDIDAKMVGLTATQTLTNKTLTAPVITGGASITGNVTTTGSFNGTTAGVRLPTGGPVYFNAGFTTYVQDSSGVLQLVTAGGTASLDASGNLLVGTANATVGTAVGGRWVEDGAGARGSRLELGSSASTNSNIGFDMYSTGAGAYRFYVGYGGTIFATSTSISAISDISLKENIRELDTGLSEVMRLKPRRFDWKNGDGANVAGFIAQELEEVLPELVYDYQYNADTTKKSIKMGDILPTLVKAVQELNEKVDKLEAEKVSLLLTLKSVEGIEARLAALEAA